MKVIFQDVDGVLNNYTSRNFGEDFTKESCSNLNAILKAVPDAQIVISSSWRFHGFDYCKQVLDDNGVDKNRINGMTGFENGSRGHQIQCWLDRNPGVTGFVILDDSSDMDHLKHKLVKVDGYIGLTKDDAKLAIDILNQPL